MALMSRTPNPIPLMTTRKPVYTPMTDEQEAHLQRIQDRLAADLAAKYRAGQEDHGGDLWTKPGMLENAYAEVLDLAIYLITLMEQRDRGCYPTGRD